MSDFGLQIWLHDGHSVHALNPTYKNSCAGIRILQPVKFIALNPTYKLNVSYNF